MLNKGASGVDQLGSINSTPSLPSALADVHQPIFAAGAIAITLTEVGSELKQSGTIPFLDTNSTLSPTASVTASTVTATSQGLVLTGRVIVCNNSREDLEPAGLASPNKIPNK